MTRRLLDYDPLTGDQQYHHYDDETDTTYIEHVSDVSPIIDANKRAQNADTDGWSKSRSMAVIAEIPITVAYQIFVKHGIKAWEKDHTDALLKLLRDPDYRYLRCSKIII